VIAGAAKRKPVSQTSSGAGLAVGIYVAQESGLDMPPVVLVILGLVAVFLVGNGLIQGISHRKVRGELIAILEEGKKLCPTPAKPEVHYASYKFWYDRTVGFLAAMLPTERARLPLETDGLDAHLDWLDALLQRPGSWEVSWRFWKPGAFRDARAARRKLSTSDGIALYGGPFDV
jgi:hypothetical protein